MLASPTAPRLAQRHAALFRRHLAQVGRVAFRAPDATDAGRRSVLDVPGADAALALLRETHALATEPAARRPRFHATVRLGPRRAEAELRVWTAVFQWERCRGLSGVPGGELEARGAVGGAQSGMLFVNDPRHAAQFWSGGIEAPLDVAFVTATTRSALGAVRCVGSLAPFPADAEPRKAAVLAGDEHFVRSGPGVTHVLETRRGWWADAGLAGGEAAAVATLAASDKLKEDLAAKQQMAEQFAHHLDALVHAALAAVDRRAAHPASAAAPLHDDEVELLCLAYALGYYGEPLDRVAATKLAAEVADGTAAASARKSELLARLFADPAVDLAPELEGLRGSVK